MTAALIIQMLFLGRSEEDLSCNLPVLSVKILYHCIKTIHTPGYRNIPLLNERFSQFNKTQSVNYEPVLRAEGDETCISLLFNQDLQFLPSGPSRSNDPVSSMDLNGHCKQLEGQAKQDIFWASNRIILSTRKL